MAAMMRTATTVAMVQTTRLCHRLRDVSPAGCSSSVDCSFTLDSGVGTTLHRLVHRIFALTAITGDNRNRNRPNC